jgi:PAS domain S-box-containing protein
MQDPQAQQQRLKTLASNTSAIVWITAPDGSIHDQENASWEAFTGQTLAQYRGWGWLDAIHPDDRDAIAQAWRRATEGKQLFEFSYRLRRHDGEYRHVLAQGAPVLERGSVREWVGVCVDVTDSRRAEAVLRESELRFRFLDRLGQAARTLTESSDVMALTARLLGEYLCATRCAYADVEADNDRFTIRNDWSAPGVPSSAGVYSLDLFGPQATTNLRRGEDLVVRDVDRELGDDGGGRMFKSIGIRAVICAGLVKGGRLVAMMAVHQSEPRDWTAGEIALVREVVDRCWAHIERVRDAAMLREQDRRKDEFLATLAHELRNPLAPIKYAVALMRQSQNPERHARAEEVIDRQVTQMARLIDDLLDLSRINRGLIQLQPEHVALAGLMRQAMESTQPALDEARHTLDVDWPDADLMLDADPTRLVQVIANLLTNAIKYTPDGGRIRLAGFRDPATGEAVIEVTDNGVGIPADQQAQLFQMFTQLGHTAGRAKGGLGIGLALARTLVQMHGGSITVASAGLGAGSTFTVRLPLAVQQTGETDDAPAPSETAGSAQKPRVLVVEDNRDGRETLVALLEILGYKVASAGDGPSAVDAAASFRPDAVLLDLGLPGFDGYEVCRRLRADPALAGTYIVALTGWGADADRKRTAEAGFDTHMTKPVEPDVLQECLSGLGAAGSRRSQPA